jgi:hypothetical protein
LGVSELLLLHANKANASVENKQKTNKENDNEENKDTKRNSGGGSTSQDHGHELGHELGLGLGLWQGLSSTPSCEHAEPAVEASAEGNVQDHGQSTTTTTSNNNARNSSSNRKVSFTYYPYLGHYNIAAKTSVIRDIYKKATS